MESTDTATQAERPVSAECQRARCGNCWDDACGCPLCGHPGPVAEPTRVERIFTFGYGHTDPDTGEDLVHRYVTVIAATAERAREVMFAVYGNAWAFEYASVEAANVPGCPPLREHARLDLTLAGAR